MAVVIPARNESDRIAATVRAAAGLAGVDLVVVVDDGSGDGTAALAEAAGASVMRHARRRGKAAAMETGAEAVRLLEAGRTAPARVTCCSWTATWPRPRARPGRWPRRCGPAGRT